MLANQLPGAAAVGDRAARQTDRQERGVIDVTPSVGQLG
jgi:hypothetical protein